MSFLNAKVVGTLVDPMSYHVELVDRGNPDFAMTRSALCEFAKCPARWKAGFRSDDSESTRNGSLLDVLLLDSKRFYSTYEEIPPVYKDAKTGEEKKWNFNATVCKEWRDERKGKVLVHSDDLVSARIALARIKENELCQSVLAGAGTQVLVTATYVDSETGLEIPVKALIDITPNANGEHRSILVDFKTARSAEIHAWTKSVFSFNYHTQGAFHLDLFVAATGEDRNTFCHIVQENVPPYQIELRMLSQEYLELGRNAYKSALAFYAQCLASKHWPGYYAETEIGGWQLVSPSAWMVMADATPFRKTPDAEPTPQPAEENFDLIP